MRPRFFVDSIQRGGERVWARIVIDKQAKQEMKLCEKRGMESKKVEKDREKLLKRLTKTVLNSILKNRKTLAKRETKRRKRKR